MRATPADAIMPPPAARAAWTPTPTPAMLAGEGMTGKASSAARRRYEAAQWKQRQTACARAARQRASSRSSG
jgi:hypothetical protein